MKNQFLNIKSNAIKAKRIKKRIDRVVVDFNKEVKNTFNLLKEEVKIKRKQDDEKHLCEIRKSLEI